MKRLLVFICIIACLLCGCGKSEQKDNSSKPIIVMPDEQTAQTLNGYIDPDLQNVKIEYVGNKNSKKLHYAECQYAKNMNSENKVTSYNRDEMIANGYTPLLEIL